MTEEKNVGWEMDTGQERDHNEDSLATVHMQQASEDDAKSVDIVAVADGMGGHSHGEIASKLAVRTAIRKVMDDIVEHDDDMPVNYRSWLESATRIANRVVYKTAESRDSNMGTTLVLAVVAGNKLHVANVGDSRAYVITDKSIRQITKDHSMLRAMLESGAYDERQIEQSPFKHALTQAIGQAEPIEIDTFTEKLPDGSYVLLCSDGLWGEVDESEIFKIVQEAESVQAACEALVKAANSAGGSDNIAVVLVRVRHGDAS